MANGVATQERLTERGVDVTKMKAKACVVGTGPNGLAAAVVLAQAGLDVDAFEAEPQPGGAARTLELTLPGFHHDFGSAVHPLAIGSPFFSSLPLQERGLEWIHSPAALAHPFDDGAAIALQSDLTRADDTFKEDGKAWRSLFQPFAERWTELAKEVLRPIRLLPRRPWLLAKFGLTSLRSAESLAHSAFRSARARAVFAGIAAHSVLDFNETMSAASAMLLGAALHSVGWPIPRGGAGAITQALSEYFKMLGGNITTSRRVDSLDSLRGYQFILCDITPRQLLNLAGNKLTKQFQRSLMRYRYGPGVFKVDYALCEPIPWKAPACSLAATVHLGGSFEEIAASEATISRGEHPERPFVLLVQPTLFDSTRAPDGKHIAWAYCHVPNGSNFDMLSRLENQIERFAPGFRNCVLARHVLSPRLLESMDANLVGGDIGGGVLDLSQFIFRPTWRKYATSAQDIYLCSSSTPPGGAVHGMCGYHAAKLALRRHRMR